MSSASISSVFRELFQAPLRALTDAEEDYRRIWADWLEVQFRFLSIEKKEGARSVRVWKDGVDFEKVVREHAPVVALNGAVDVGITMRIASVKEFNGNVGFGVALGPVYASGGFGFTGRSSKESLFQASTQFTVSNQPGDLSEYLSNRNVTLAEPSDVESAVKFLRQASEVKTEGKVK